jgi:hypothetical protein
MGITLSNEDDTHLSSIRKPCFAALGLANDYFSFDREYAELRKSGTSRPLLNLVWLHMQWHNVDVGTAKEMTRQATVRYEREFIEKCTEYRRLNPGRSEDVERYLDALGFQISGNVVWSLNCPRYHQEYRYDANAGMEDAMTAEPF